MFRRVDGYGNGRTCLGGLARGGLTGVLAVTALLLYPGCSRRDYSFGGGAGVGAKDASADRTATSTSDASVASDSVQTDASADPFAGIGAAPVVANVSFPRAVASTVVAGDNVLVLFADQGLALLDPIAPVQSPALPTDGKVVAAEYDEEQGLAYAVDLTGKLYVFSARSTDGFAKLYESAVFPGLVNKVVGMARLGSTVHVLTGDSVVPVSFAFTGDLPTGSSAGTPLALSSPATHIAAGGGVLYLALKGVLQVWSVPSNGAAAKLGEYPLSAEARALIAMGSKVLVGVAGEGLSTVDFGNPAAPVRLALDRSLYDLTKACLFGRTLAAGLARNLTTTIDLSDFAAPRVLAVDQGEVPQFMAVLNGVLLRGVARGAQVVSIPPTISAPIPAPTASSFPLHGQIPVTFSKPIDPSSASTVTLACAGMTIAGQAVVALARNSLSFIPSVLLPANASCTLDLTAIKDANGLSLVGRSILTLTTAAAASSPITNNGSKYPHIVDGAFTDSTEWSDVTPVKGMYTHLYADFQNGKLNILNDWLFNSEKMDPECYSELYLWTGAGSEQWTIRTHADRKVTVLKNGVLVDSTTSGVVGGAGYGPSPSFKEPHTIYELQIAAEPGAWGVRLHSPGATFSCNRLVTEPSHIVGTLGASGVTIDSTQKPAAPVAATLLSPSQGASVGTVTPTLTWTSGSKEALNMLQYQVQISNVGTFANLLWKTGTMSASTTVPSGVLGMDKTYYWRVVASNTVGLAPSTASSFLTSRRVSPDAGYDVAPKEAGVRETGYDASVDRKPSDTLGEVAGERGLSIEFVDVSHGDAMGPGRGTVSSEPGNLKCSNGSGTCSAFFAVGSRVILFANAEKGWHFSGWGGDCTRLLDANSSFTMTAGEEPLSCTARFDLGVPDAGSGGTGGSTAGNSGTDAAAGSGGTGGMDAAAGSGGTAGTIVDAPVDLSSSSDAGADDADDGYGDSADVLAEVCGVAALDGVNDLISVPSGAYLNVPNSFTIEAWVYPTAFSSSYQEIAARYQEYSEGTAIFDLGLTRDGIPFFEVMSGGYGTARTVTASQAIALNQWTHIAGVFTSGTSLVIYVNGQAVASQTVSFESAQALSDVPFTIGRLPDASSAQYPFKGYVDEVRYSASARYAATFTPAASFTSDSNTILLFHFEEGAGTSALDSSSNKSDATLAQGAQFASFCR